MADIKFMDISENDNPATTDSVLIANETNGVKRTALANLGKVLNTNGLIQLQRVAVKLSTSTNGQYQLTAPNVANYTFLFWIAPQISVLAGSAHTDTPQSSTAQFYTNITDSRTSPDAEVVCFAVYIKNTIA